MSNSSILGGTSAPLQADGKDVDLLGPSDTSDSGSDVQGERSMRTAPDNPGEWGAVVADGASDSDAGGTGERASADGDDPLDGADIMPDRVIDGLDADVDPADRRKTAAAGDLELDDDDDDDDAEKEGPDDDEPSTR